MADRQRHLYRLSAPVPWWSYGDALPDELRHELAFWRRFIVLSLVVLALAACLWVVVQ